MKRSRSQSPSEPPLNTPSNIFAPKLGEESSQGPDKPPIDTLSNIFAQNLSEERKQQFWSRSIVHACCYDDVGLLQMLLSEISSWDGLLLLPASYFCFAATLAQSAACNQLLQTYSGSQEKGIQFCNLHYGLYGWFYLLEDAIKGDDASQCESLLGLIRGDWDGILCDARYLEDRSVFCLARCCDCNAFKCFDIFLKYGLPLERPDGHGKTILFEVADNAEKIMLNTEMICIGLRRGGSLEGEFRFNSETVLSIATWKTFAQLFPNKAKTFFHVTNTPWSDAVQPSVISGAWKCIEAVLEQRARSPFLFDALDEVASFPPSSIQEAWAHIDEATHTESAFDAYLMLRYVFSLETQTYPLSDQLKARARQILFKDCIPSFSLHVNIPQQYWIAQYRGIFYRPKHWSADQVELDGYVSHLNRILPAGATFSSAGNMPGQTATSRESDLKEAVSRLHAVRAQLEHDRDGQGFCQLVELAACNYGAFNQAVLDGSTEWGVALRDIKAIGYPTWASSALPTHAVRYALGKGDRYQDNPYKLDKSTPAPFYSPNGSPRRKFFGKVFIALLTVEDMHKAVNVMEMARQGEISLSRYVSAERETGFWGGLELGKAWFEMALEVPDLSLGWSKSMEQKFGCNASTWKKWQAKVQKNEWDISFLTRKEGPLENHWRTMLLDIAVRETQRRGGQLVYWNPEVEGNVSPKPPSAPGYAELFKYELYMIQNMELKTKIVHTMDNFKTSTN